MAIAQAELTSTASSVFTASSDVAITTLFICNRHYEAISFDMWMVPNTYSNTSPANTHAIIVNIPIEGEDTFLFDVERILLSSGDKVYARMNTNPQANSVTSTIIYTAV